MIPSIIYTTSYYKEYSIIQLIINLVFCKYNWIFFNRNMFVKLLQVILLFCDLKQIIVFYGILANIRFM